MGELSVCPEGNDLPRRDKWKGRLFVVFCYVFLLGVTVLSYFYTVRASPRRPIDLESPVLDAYDGRDSLISNLDSDKEEAEDSYDSGAIAESSIQAGDGATAAQVPFVLSREEASAFVAQSRCARKGMRLVEIRNKTVASNILPVLTGETEAFWISGVNEKAGVVGDTRKVVDWQHSPLYHNFNTLKAVCLSLESFGWSWDLNYRIVSAPCIRKKRYICQTYQ